MESRRIHVGTSGWHYRHWKGLFYPDSLPSTKYLEYYLRFFQTVELNNFFYRLPSRETMDNWRDAVPDGFIFAVKANRYITHMKKLGDPQEPLANLYDRVTRLGSKAGPILFQLPPRWRYNRERLQVFLNALSRDFRYAFEFREPTWFNDEVYDLLATHQAAFCIFELDGLISPFQVTAPFIYIRLHGPGGKYQGSYSDEALDGWAKKIREWHQQGREVYCYFDNDEAAYAVQNAQALRQLTISNEQ